MSQISIRLSLVAGTLIAASLTAGADGGSALPATRNDLVGSWRLVSIDVVGPKGPEQDPFYGAGTQGLLIYDRSGWFSVQFAGKTRPALDVPTSRPEYPNAVRDGLKAAALDSYYAYYGTWSFDAASSTVSHHSKGALYPGETGVIYQQHVQVQGSRMTFTRIQGRADQTTIQTKVWERLQSP